MRATRQKIATAGLALAALMMSGCSAPAAPFEPEALPVFASDEEAFAAAEATYRAYVDASNEVNLADSESFEAVFALTNGALNAADRKTLSAMHARGFELTGETRIRSVHAGAISGARDNVRLEVCLDVSELRLLDVNGESAVDPSRRPQQALTVSFVPSSIDPTQLVASLLEPSQGTQECG